MSPSQSRILPFAAAIGLFLCSTALPAQRGEPQWVDITPAGKLMAKMLGVTGGTMDIRGGVVVRPSNKTFIMPLNVKPENMVVGLFLGVSNESPDTVWVEMEIDVPGQEKASVKSAEIKNKHWYRELWALKELQWGFQYPVKVSAYSDKNKTNSLGTTTAFLVFDDADKPTLEKARNMAAEGVRAGAMPLVTFSGWGNPSAEEAAAFKKMMPDQQPPPFEWKEDEGSPGVTLTATERKRTSGREGLVVFFDLNATGFGAGEDLTFWTKYLGGNNYMRMSDVSLNEKGAIQGKLAGKPVPIGVGVGKMAAGEPISWALASATTGKRAYARAVIVPIESHSAEGCSASAELRSPSGFVFLVTFRGFAPGEEVEITSQFKDENKPLTVHADDKGLTSFPVLFGEGDHGKAKATAAGKGCKVSLEYQVGPDALVKR